MQISTEVAAGNRTAAQALLDTLVEQHVDGKASTSFAIGKDSCFLALLNRVGLGARAPSALER